MAAAIASLPLMANPIGPSSFNGSDTLIDFDDLPGGNCNLCGPSVLGQYAGLGATFNDPSYLGDDTADTNLTASFALASPPNALYVYQGGLIGQAPAQPFQILFSVPVTMVGFDYGSSPGSFLEVSAYGAEGQLLETLTFDGMSAPIGLEGFAGIQETSPITSLTVSYRPYSDPSRTFNFSIDNLEFGTVPEPASITLVFVGLCGLILAQRRKARGLLDSLRGCVRDKME